MIKETQITRDTLYNERYIRTCQVWRYSWSHWTLFNFQTNMLGL